MIKILLYLWQLPQNILGMILDKIYCKGHFIMYRTKNNTIKIILNPKFRSGISLGNYIVLKGDTVLSKYHELGHCKQSIMLGWLYLIVIGIPSITHNILHSLKIAKGDYYNYWCEKWADKLGGILHSANKDRFFSK